MHSKLYSFLDDNKCLYIYNLQFGFIHRHSTTHTLVTICDEIQRAIDTGDYACGVFIDLQKAFDTVNHKILIEKLYHYGTLLCLIWGGGIKRGGGRNFKL